jgi:hypothetical protein
VCGRDAGLFVGHFFDQLLLFFRLSLLLLYCCLHLRKVHLAWSCIEQ